MRRSSTVYGFVLVAACSASVGDTIGTDTIEADGGTGDSRVIDPPAGHGYFDMLVARPDHWKSYSFRDQAQIDSVSAGDRNTRATYSPSTDADPQAQDAMKTVIEPWKTLDSTLTANIEATQTVIPMSNVGSAHKGAFKLDDEIVELVSRTADSVTVIRGIGGTTPAAHALGTQVLVSNNSLRNQPRPPLVTEDGYTYLFTWDSYHTDSWFKTGLTNYKAFQFASGGDREGAIWLEPQTVLGSVRIADVPSCFDPAIHVYELGLRPYNQEGTEADWTLTDSNHLPPTSLGDGQLEPRIGRFCGRAGVWTRWWFRIEQRADDFDYVTAWMADEDHGPVKVLDRVGVSVRSWGAYPNAITSFYVELNTSNDSYNCPGRCEKDLVTYVRNFAGLRTLGRSAGSLADGEIEMLLARPAR